MSTTVSLVRWKVTKDEQERWEKKEKKENDTEDESKKNSGSKPAN
jgi:hypothetical protein